MLEPRKPPIMKLVIWQEARRWIYPQRDTLKPRGHFGFMRDIPEGLAKRLERLQTKCVKCGKLINPVRSHHNASTLTLHVTGSRNNGCRFCSYGNEARAAVLALQLDLGQAERSPKILKSKDAARQQKLFNDDEE